MPDVTFAGVALPNRVDTNNDQFPAMNRFRIKTITSETGGKLDVTLLGAGLCQGHPDAGPERAAEQHAACYPVKWTPSGYTEPDQRLLPQVPGHRRHRERPDRHVEPRSITHYDYLGDPAWHYTDDDGLIKDDYKTWSVWRGYGAVRTIKGDPGEQTSTETRYFRGMHGDKLPSGTRTVIMPAIAIGNVPAINDEDAFAGAVRETITFNGPAAPRSRRPSPSPGSRPRPPPAPSTASTVHARHVSTEADAHPDHARRRPRHRTTTTAAPRSTATACRSGSRTAATTPSPATSSARSPTTSATRRSWLMDRSSRTRTFAVDCTRALAGGLTDDDIIATPGPPTTSWPGTRRRPRATRHRSRERSRPTTAATRRYITDSRSVHDAYGRVVESYDVRGQKTTTAYHPVDRWPGHRRRPRPARWAG